MTVQNFTTVLGLSVGEDFAILACVVFTQCQRVTDRQTDRQTEGRWCLYNLSHAMLLQSYMGKIITRHHFIASRSSHASGASESRTAAAIFYNQLAVISPVCTILYIPYTLFAHWFASGGVSNTDWMKSNCSPGLPKSIFPVTGYYLGRRKEIVSTHVPFVPHVREITRDGSTLGEGGTCPRFTCCPRFKS